MAHLAALELRPSLYAAQGHGSLFDYCTQALRLSEDAACTRIRAARTCRAFPMVLDLLSSGAVSVTTVRLLQPHLTDENHQAVLARARYKRREEIEALVAELAPKPDVPSTLRKLPAPTAPNPGSRPSLFSVEAAGGGIDAEPPPLLSAAAGSPPTASGDERTEVPAACGVSSRTGPAARSVMRASAPQRYRVQFTIGQETHDKVRRLQALLRREVPNGDLAVIFDRAVDLMLEKVERTKLAKRVTPSQGALRRGDGAYENRIRSWTDKRSRRVPNEVKRIVWQRDEGQCAFVSAAGHRCTQRAFLELHHIQPYALEGPTTATNVSLRCRRHNSYEAELVFGPGKIEGVTAAGA